MAAPSRGSVVLIPFPFSDLSQSKYRIVGIINDHYIVQTPKALKKPKVLN
ncbi:MAG: hypothetical protein K8F52_09600 [Candidatus Scalindua rubra]|nr:hypothetical protein [Candidatus Scalindua rubra]TWU29088.1 hypothetical protein S225a_26120 [Candidatus Brocadiaceae bacterium S225]